MTQKVKSPRLLKRLLMFTVGGIVLFYLALWTYVMTFWGWDAYLSPIPRLESYEAQKQWAIDRHDRVSYASEITGCPRLYWSWPLRAYQALFKLYPDRATQDENVWASLGTCYTMLRKYDKALEAYQRQLGLFKAQYYKKDYPQKREVGILKTELEEIKWIANIHKRIADVYLRTRQPLKAIAEYEKIVDGLGPKLQKYSKWEQYKVVGDSYEEIAFIYANSLKDYQKAIASYETVANLFSEEPLAVSHAKTSIADCYIAMGDFEKGKALYRAVIEEFPDPSKGYASLAKQRLKRVEAGDLAHWYVGP